ncbi:uncharacterized protein J3D65DRAFT_612299 [Phyllosticta citribraziliensis]|uniref:NADP-dependent oxidoreductase domain-containing protein n=1 Tax=Phyllosticta citribraziliensis TaxID=989973 RepID=A0ABR1M684_9PEZI
MASLTAQRSSLVRVIGHPPLIYTSSVRQAGEGPYHAHFVQEGLKTGFTAIDASNSEKLPANEENVGDGIREALQSQGLTREQIFVQAACKWPRYKLWARPLTPEFIQEYVHASVQKTLHNLRHEEDNAASAYVDCLLLDYPKYAPETVGTPETFDAWIHAAWQALETYVPQQVRYLGVRNWGMLKRLGVLYRNANVKPAVAQCALYPKNQWELPMRMFCARNDMVYQADGVLGPKNQSLITSTPVSLLAEFAKVSRSGALLALLMAMEVPVLNDEKVVDVARHREEVLRVEEWAKEKEDSWTTLFDDFVHQIRT